KSLDNIDTIKKLAKKYVDTHNLFFLGRKLDYLLALEASLKLKEISYIHSEAYPAGELKHGTISLIEKDVPVIALVSDESILEKTMSNIQEVKARGSEVLLITNQPIDHLKDNVASVLKVEPTSAILACFTMILPLQLMAYYVALFRGCDVDQPRNLAKSVTVE
ncbi:MAG TPA: SIS domain-containing protein, partial [Erysipelothrix sp.]|nr:SIS domain-containing protein [Erysipelothrix sp.]